MAFTKTPQNDTYQTKQLRLFQPLDKRSSSATKDNDYLNGYFELQQDKPTDTKDAHFVKRPGTLDFSATLPSSNVRGLIHWEDQDKIYVAVDDDVVVVNASTGAIITTLNAVFGAGTTKVGFTFFYYDSTATKVVGTDGTTLVTIDSANTVVTCADGDLPSPHIAEPVFLDGYLFLAKFGTADIFNSDLNDPLAWTPGNFLSAEMYPDNIREIGKLNNYLVAFGSETIEYFWDAGNASGSPLQRNDTPIKLVGYLGGLAQSGNQMYFVGKSNQGTPTVYQLEDFKIKDVATESIRKYLQSVIGIVFAPIGNIVSGNGRDFYVMNVGTLTYVLDIQSELWYRWAFQGTDTFPVKVSFTNDISSGNLSIIFITGQTKLFMFAPGVYQDAGINFTCHLITDKEYFETYNQKWMNRLMVWGDKPGSSAVLNVSWTDDDYLTFTTPVNLELNQELPALTRLGRFRRRAFKFAFTQNQALRIESVEVNINMGQT